MSTNPQRSENADRSLHTPSQESRAHVVQNPNQITNHTDVRHGLQSLSPLDVTQSRDILRNGFQDNPSLVAYEGNPHTAIQSQSVSHDGISLSHDVMSVSNNGISVSHNGISVSPEGIFVSDHGISGIESERSEICIGGSSINTPEQFRGIIYHNTSASFSGHRFSPQLGVQQSRPFHPGSNPATQNQFYQQQHNETAFSDPTRSQTVRQQQNRSDDLLSVIGHVRSPIYADLTSRLDTFSNWPLDTSQTPESVADAGFYYTGFLDIVRCFACDGGLKNWDPEDNPWIEHARWFPQCPYVRHKKGEDFINLVRMASEESDEDDDLAVHRGATWKGADNPITNPDTVLSEIKEPSVLETKDAKIVMEMGFEMEDVALAINDILRKGKQDFTHQEILDILLEKDISGKLNNYKLSAGSPPSQENTSDTEQVMSKNKHLKELLQCTECKVKERNILFLPCTHHIVCASCSANLEICTKCYRKIKEKVRTFMS